MLTDDEKRELIAEVRDEFLPHSNDVWACDLAARLADALEGTLTEPEWQYQARVEWLDPHDERRRPNFYIGKDRAFTAEEMANPVLIDDSTGRNVVEGCYLKDHVKRRKAGPWIEVPGV